MAIACAAHAAIVALTALVSGRVRGPASSGADLVVTFQERAPAKEPGDELFQLPRAVDEPVVPKLIAARVLSRRKPPSTPSLATPPPDLPPALSHPDAPRGPGEVTNAASATTAGVGAGTSGTAGSPEGGSGAFRSAATAATHRVGPPNLTVVPFGEGMTRPSLLSKVDPAYTREALEAKVEGLMIVRCVITTQGALERCRIVKGLPHMNEAVLTALTMWRYTPTAYQGQLVNIDYNIPVRLVMP
jgi:protein TonB